MGTSKPLGNPNGRLPGVNLDGQAFHPQQAGFILECSFAGFPQFKKNAA